MSPTCLNGDSRDAKSYERLLAGRKARLLCTDPPYCLLVRRRKGGDERDPKGRKIERDPVGRFEDVRSYRLFTEGWLPPAIACLEGDAPLVIWTNFLGKEPIRATARACGYPHLWGEFTWGKRTSEKDGNELLLRVYEVALVLGRAPLPAQGPGEPPRCWAVAAGYDDEGEAARWGSHPNHKPFGVIEPLLRAYSRPGELVLDPFAGSGSIPAAAVRLGLEAACLEIDPEFAALVQRRLAGAGGPA